MSKKTKLLVVPALSIGLGLLLVLLATSAASATQASDNLPTKSQASPSTSTPPEKEKEKPLRRLVKSLPGLHKLPLMLIETRPNNNTGRKPEVD